MAHISYSELAKWDFCPYARKLIYEDKVRKFKGNIFTGFGSAIHSVCEKYFESGRELDKKFFFGEAFRKQLKTLEKNGEKFTEKQITDFYNQGLAITEELDAGFDKYFGTDFEFIKAEDTLMEASVSSLMLLTISRGTSTLSSKPRTASITLLITSLVLGAGMQRSVLTVW